MGNCVPVHQKSKEPNMKFKYSIDAQRISVQTESPIKENAVSGGYSMAELDSKTQSLSPVPYERSFRDLSNREEMFFDSQQWLDSDCEDYVSIHGDFTPSCDTSPIHQSSFVETPPHDKSLHISSTTNSIPEPSSYDMKKQLIELFRESFGSDPVDDHLDLQDRMENKPVTVYRHPKSRTPHESASNLACNSENRRFNTSKEKTAYSEQCCLPNLVRSLSFSERKKNLQSPACRGGQ